MEDYIKHYEDSRRGFNIKGESHLEYYKLKHFKKYKKIYNQLLIEKLEWVKQAVIDIDEFVEIIIETQQYLNNKK
tara:strand:- start:1020 stop:1244 length:225 start_codon:yes stop_codon:yes gene_type:complete